MFDFSAHRKARVSASMENGPNKDVDVFWISPETERANVKTTTSLLYNLGPFSMCAFSSATSHMITSVRFFCYFHEHLHHAKVYHVIQVLRVCTPVNFHSAETSTRAHMIGNNEYNNTNTFPTRKVE